MIDKPEAPTSREWRLWSIDAHATARRVTRNSDLAGDLAQEALVRLMRCYAGVRDLHNWLFVVLRRLAAKSAMSARGVAERPLLFEPVGPAAANVEQSLDLERALRTLPARQASLLALTLEGYSHAEIAQRIGCATHQVGPRVARAQRALARKLGSRSQSTALVPTPSSAQAPEPIRTARRTPRGGW